jgi:hypothetical protein
MQTPFQRAIDSISLIISTIQYIKAKNHASVHTQCTRKRSAVRKSTLTAPGLRLSSFSTRANTQRNCGNTRVFPLNISHSSDTIVADQPFSRRLNTHTLHLNRKTGYSIPGFLIQRKLRAVGCYLVTISRSP